MADNQKLSYEIFDPLGKRVMHGTFAVRYPARTERDLLDAGYRIRIDGKFLKKDGKRKCENI